MSNPSINLLRARVLASAAAVSLIAAGAVGEATLTASHPARAAAVVTSDLPGPAMPSFAPLIGRVKPAVVSVKVKMARDASVDGDQLAQLPPEIQKFFRQFGENGAGQNAQPLIRGEGSGFFISSDGYVLTNNHVVQNSKSVTVTMDDGKVLDAKVVGTDPKTDLALLKVEEPGDYPFVSLASQAPKIGDWVVAIGNPYGLGGTVTAGIISAEGRDIGEGPYDRFLQIDAPINKGNSGGPAFNTAGQVVGVNTAIFSPSGGSVGIGFAIPATTASEVVDQLEHGGVVRRGYLGVQIQPVGPEIAEALGLKTAAGAIVDKAMPGAPAAQAGVKAGDVITEINGQTIKDAADLTRRIGAMKPGDKVTLTYLRKGAQATSDVTLADQKDASVARSAPNADESASPQIGQFGLRLGPATGNGEGVAIAGVDPDGAAAAKGLKAGDVILDVAGSPVSRPEDVKSGIASARQEGKKAVLMRIQTAQGDVFVAFALPKA